MKLHRSAVTVASALVLSSMALSAASTASAAPSVTPSPVLASAGVPWQTTIPLPAALVDSGGVVGAPDDHTDLRLSLSGLPSKITAGSGWQRFTLTETLPVTGPNSDLGASPHEIHWTLALADDRAGQDALARYAHVQYLDGSAWTALPAWAGNRTEPVVTHFAVAGNQQQVTVRIPLRVRVDAGAPAGQAYAVAVGSYTDVIQGSFVHTSLGSQAVSVTPGAATRPASSSSSPSPRPAAAEPDASSALPLIAGAVLVVGGGAAVAMRRRRSRA